MGDFVNELYSGSHYELSIQYTNVAHAVQALNALQAMPLFHNKHDFAVSEQDLQALVKIWQSTLQIDAHTFPCLISLVNAEDGTTFIDFAIPVNELSAVYDLHYPIDNATNPWLTNVHYVLLDLTERIYDIAPFSIAVIGEEVTGSFDAEHLTADDVERLTCILPTSLQQQLGIQHEGLPLSTKLALYE